MLHICCINWRNYQGRGVEYVNVLYDMVRRNLESGTEGEFVVFTDRLKTEYHPDIMQRLLPDGLFGWWNKLWLFADGVFPENDRVLFFDLDTLVVGSIDDIAAYHGDFAMLRDAYRPDGLQSSVMAWRAGYGAHLWSEYVKSGYPTHDPLGDQHWIEQRVKPDVLQTLFPGAFVSFKVDCNPYPPKGARVVVFHGTPRPHEVSGWVADAWKVGGIGAVEILVRCNTALETIRANVEYSLSLGLPELTEQSAHDGIVCIVGGAPSLRHHIADLANRARNGQKIWALNGAARFLLDRDVPVDAQWIVDARPENWRFVTHGMTQYLASQCAPEVFHRATDAVIYHEINTDEFLPKNRAVTLIGGGTTVGMKAIAGAFALGYRRMHIYGMDSSFDGEAHHAYEQTQNDADYRLTVNVEDRAFEAAPWMIRQAEDFQSLAHELAERDCEITVHCGGLLGFMARKMAEARVEPEECAGDIVKYLGWWRPADDHVSVQAVLGEVWKLEYVVNALPMSKRRVALQAGGHVGIFPMKLADLFKQVHSFEPDARNFECLVRNVSKPNILLHHVALGRERGSIALHERERHNCGSIAVDQNSLGDIPLRRIDDYDFNDVDLIYLDIEGMEGLALLGALDTVERCRPLIVVENKGLDGASGASGALSEFLHVTKYKTIARVMRDDLLAHPEYFAAFDKFRS